MPDVNIGGSQLKGPNSVGNLPTEFINRVISQNYMKEYSRLVRCKVLAYREFERDIIVEEEESICTILEPEPPEPPDATKPDSLNPGELKPQPEPEPPRQYCYFPQHTAEWGRPDLKRSDVIDRVFIPPHMRSAGGQAVIDEGKRVKISITIERNTDPSIAAAETISTVLYAIAPDGAPEIW